MPQIEHEIKVHGAPEQVFAALTTLQGITSWQTPQATGTGEVGSRWKFTFEGLPDFVWEVRSSEPSRVEWLCIEGPGDSAGTTAAFDISETDDGRTLVELTHSGWPSTRGNFRKCNTLWGVLLFHLAQSVRTGNPAPAFD